MISKKYKILLVEDEPADAKLVDRHLKKLRADAATLTCVVNMADAKKMLESSSFDAILLDLNLPDCDGDEIMQRILTYAAATPIIVLIGYASDAAAKKAVSLGAQDYISKRDISTTNILQKIEYAIERHRLIEELKKAKDAEAQANAAKSSFLAVMSHEIRTPLNGILGMSQIVMDTNLSSEQNEYVAAIKRSAENLLVILNDLLDFSKVEAGKIDLEVLPFDLKQVLKQFFKTQELAHPNPSVNLHFACKENWETLFEGDVGRLQQILSNLFSNAVKFTKRGNIWLRVTSKPATAGHQTHRFEVQDEGIGMPPSILQKLFQPFSQGESSTARRFGGTGLGLSICKRLVELMGGQIGVTSQEGKGTMFWFEITLPVGPRIMLVADEQEQGNKTHQQTDRQTTSPHRVLIVDDNSINQKIALKYLEKFGYRADAVGGGREAIAALKTGGYKLILMDCQMPELDGYETTKLIRQSEAKTGESIVIVAMTANVQKSERERCLAVGMNDFVSKPIAMEHLRATLEKWLSGSRSSSPQLHSTVAAPGKATLDFNILSQIRSLDGPEETSILVELGESFLRDFPAAVATLRDRLDQGDYEGVRFKAHQLVSNAGSLAALNLSEILRELENAQSTEDQERSHKILQMIEVEFERVRIALIQEMGRAA